MIDSQKNISAQAPFGPEDFWDEAETLGRALAAQLDYFQALGVEGLPADMFSEILSAPERPERRPAAAAVEKARPERPARANMAAGPSSSEEPSAWAPPAADLEALFGRLPQCRACPLGERLSHRPGRGSPSPLVLVIVPQPSMLEGPDGELLIAMLEKGLELTPDEYYLTSLIKCPAGPGEKPPAQADAACRPIWLREVELTRPQSILALGRTAGAQLTGLTREPLLMLRGRSHRFGEAWLRVTYDLEDIRQDINIKKAAWEDLKRFKQGLPKLRSSRKR